MPSDYSDYEPIPDLFGLDPTNDFDAFVYREAVAQGKAPLTEKFTPDELVLQDVLDTLGIQRFEQVITMEVDPTGRYQLRGVRFNSITDALIYLHDAGILVFSQVNLDNDEIAIAVDKCSGDPDCIERMLKAAKYAKSSTY